jgi:hypothetical protein
MPTDQSEAVAFLKAGEDRDRANARVIDKVMLALPRELNVEQRTALVRDFAEAVTQGRAPWLAAFHEGGKDAENPHAHLVIRDRDIETGKRVALLSEKGSTERLRLLWEQRANQALLNANSPERIDRRTLKAQGFKRRPTIHEGVRARRARQRGRILISRRREVLNSALAKNRLRLVDYPSIDQGKARSEYNATLHAQEFETDAELWTVYDEDLKEQEMKVLRAFQSPEEADKDDWLVRRELMRQRKRQRGLNYRF